MGLLLYRDNFARLVQIASKSLSKPKHDDNDFSLLSQQSPLSGCKACPFDLTMETCLKESHGSASKLNDLNSTAARIL